MEQLDKPSENFAASDPQAAEALLRSMSQDIENLRQTLLVQLSQDIERLHKEKAQLIEEVETLHQQRQQQIAQQQKLARQIAPALANQLQELLLSHLSKIADSSTITSPQEAEKPIISQQAPLESAMGVPASLAAKDYQDNAYQLIASLDSTLRTTFKTLQQDLSSYQSSLSQQLSQMYSLEQQGEAILEALVSRLKKEIQSETVTLQRPTQATSSSSPLSHFDEGNYPRESNRNGSPVAYPPEPPASTIPLVPQPEPTPPVVPQSLGVSKLVSKAQPASKLRVGFTLILLSSLMLSLLNVVITIILNKSPIFGLFELGGFISPSLGNSLLILWLRMLVVVPLMAALATALYPQVWQDIKQFAQSKDWGLYLQVLGSGFFLFLSQVLIYLALGPLSPGIAITIFFVYPIFTVLLAWVLFGDRPSLLRGIIIFCVLAGVVFITLPTSGTTRLSGLGVGAAAGSGIAFAFYVILTQMCAKKLNPIPFSWINFAIILTLSGLSLALPLPDMWRFDVNPTMWPSLIVSCLLLGCITLVSYLLNNIGISLIGAARASILGATGPALTALLAWFVIQRELHIQQLVGMLLVTLGVAALSFERLRRSAKPAPQTAGK